MRHSKTNQNAAFCTRAEEEVMPQSWWASGPLPPEGGVPSPAGTPPSGGSGIKPAVTEALQEETSYP